MATKKAPEASRAKPSHEEIQARALKIYEARVKANKPGSAEGDWLQAEKELAARKK